MLGSEWITPAWSASVEKREIKPYGQRLVGIQAACVYTRAQLEAQQSTALSAHAVVQSNISLCRIS